MRQFLRTALAGAVLAGMLAVSAAAADFTGCAAQLQALGLFRGSGQGYELDRAPTRAEAAVMLVRLLGEEQQALALQYDAPFTDLYDWQQPYVQYLYENGLTTGVSATTFAPEEACSAQMYAAFVLRALGYTEAEGDYTYDSVLAFAGQAGLYDPAVTDTADFLRDDVAAASYTALSLPVKDSGQSLLDSLVADGAVEAQAAAPVQALFSSYGQYRAATADMEALQQYTVREGLTVSLSGAGTDGTCLQMEGSKTVDRTQGSAAAGGTLTLYASGVAPYTQTYQRDAAGQDGAVRAGLLYGYGVVPLACAQSIEQMDGTWTVTLAGLPAPYAGSLWALAHAGGAFESAGDAALVQTVQDGRIASQTLTAALEQNGTALQAVLTAVLDSEA